MNYKTERRIISGNNINFFHCVKTCGKYQLPVLARQNDCPIRIIDFNFALHRHDFSAGVHFFMENCKIERFWNRPERYMPLLAKFSHVFAPDFPLYSDMPQAMQIWNTYRSRLLGAVMQNCGISVIPTISWSDERSFEFCFDGIEEGGVVAVSTVGAQKNIADKKAFGRGFDAMLARIRPHTVIIYGHNDNILLEDAEKIFFSAGN